MQSTGFPTHKVEKILKDMKDKHIAFKDILSYVLDSRNPSCASYRRWMFDDLESILARIDQYKRGREILRTWSVSFVCKLVDREMHKVKKALTMKTSEITPVFVEAWSFPTFQDVIGRNAPTLCQVLLAGVQTARAKNERKKDPTVVCAFPNCCYSC